MSADKSKLRKLITLIGGLIFLGMGMLFMFIPFIPLGYIFLVVALFLLSYNLPFMRNFIKSLRKKDKGNYIDKIEHQVDKTERKVERFIIDSDEPDLKN
jgi:uncharacterized membrane protein